MTATGRELVAGIGAAGVFVGLFLVGGMPWWLALILAGGSYAGLRFILPETALLEGGVTAAELRALVQGGRQHLATLRTLAERLKRLQPAVSTDVSRLCVVAERILGRFEREPKSLQLAGLFPMYLETIAGNLQRYAALSAEAPGSASQPERLSATEDMVRAAVTEFEHIWERLSREDWLALEAEAETLRALFQSDLH